MIVSKLKLVFICSLFASILSANTSLQKDVKKELEFASKYFKLDAALLKALAIAESTTRPYSIGIIVKDAPLFKEYLSTSPFYKKTMFFKQKKNFFSIHLTNKKDASKFFDVFVWFLKETKISKVFAVGLMQINSINFKPFGKEDEIKDYFLDYKKNIAMGVLLYKDCSRAFKGDMKKAIECYNKGTDSKKFKKYDYFEIVNNHMKKIRRKI